MSQMPQTRVLFSVEKSSQNLVHNFVDCQHLLFGRCFHRYCSMSMTNTATNSTNVVLQRALAANQELMATAEVKKSYLGELKRYQRWLLSQTSLQQQPQLSVENIETYFASEVAYRKGKTKTVDKWVAAIQYCVDKEPKGPHLPAGFKLRTNERIKTALQSQKLRNIASGGTANPGSDPHKGLKDHIREADRNSLMTYIYNHRPDWGPASLSFTWGLNAALHGASNRKMVYADWFHMVLPLLAQQTAGMMATGLLYCWCCDPVNYTKTDMTQMNKLLCGATGDTASVLCLQQQHIWYGWYQTTIISISSIQIRNNEPSGGTCLLSIGTSTEVSNILRPISIVFLQFGCWRHLVAWRHLQFCVANFERIGCCNCQSNTPSHGRTTIWWVQWFGTLADQHNDEAHARKTEQSVLRCVRTKSK